MNKLCRAKESYWDVRERWLEWMNLIMKPKTHKIIIIASLINSLSILLWNHLMGLLLGRKLIVIALTEHMGDIVAAQPIAAHIKLNNPQAQLVWITRKPFEELVNSFGVIDRVISVQCITEWMLLRDSGFFYQHYDLHVNKRCCPICKKTILRKTGNPLIDTENYYNFGTLLAIMCQNAGLPILDKGPVLLIPDMTIKKVDRIGLPEKFIILHTSSNESSRDWMPEKWSLLAQQLLENSDYSLIEIGLSPTLQIESPRYLSCCGKFSIIDTAEIIHRATLFIGIDSGPAHIANAVQTYGIILNGSYRAFPKYLSYSGGYGNGDTAVIISAEGPASIITVEEVMAVFTNKFEVGEVSINRNKSNI